MTRGYGGLHEVLFENHIFYENVSSIKIIIIIITLAYRRQQRVRRGYRGLQVSDRGLQGVAGGYIGLQGVTGG